MIAEELRAAIKKRKATCDEWDYGVQKCCDEEIEILSRNMEETIAFLENECTADDLIWISEVCDDVVDKTQSREFVDCLYRIAKKYSSETKGYSIVESIEFAESILGSKLYSGRPPIDF